MAEKIDYNKELNDIKDYINRLPFITNKLKDYYLNKLDFAILNIKKHGKNSIPALECLMKEMPLEMRKPVLDFLDKIRDSQIIKINQKKGEQNYDYLVDIAVVCALKDPELNQVLRCLSNTSVESDRKERIGSHSWYLGEFRPNQVKGDEERIIKVVAAHQTKIGIVDCAILSTKIIQRWRPRFIVMTGVCGGRESSGVKLGDIIIPSEIFTYQSGEFTNQQFKVQPKFENMNHNMSQLVERYQEDIVYKIIKDWPSKIEKIPRVWQRPLACGDAIINRDNMLDNISSIHSKVIGVDMESYAVLRATQLLSEYNTTPLVIKSVMDYTTKRGSKTDKPLAAFTSARFLYYFALDALFPIIKEYS